MAKKISPRVKQLRLDKAASMGRTISIREVSRETGIAVSTLRRLEEDKAEGVDFGTLIKLAEFYGVSSTNDVLSLEDARRALYAARAVISQHGVQG